MRAGQQDLGRADHPEQASSVGRPADGDGRADQGVFEDQAPADEPGHRLAHGDITVGIGAARGGDHGRKLGVAQRRAGADRAGDQERQDHAGPGQARADAGQGVDARADDGPHAQGDQVRPAQRLLQLVAAMASGHGVDRLAARPETQGHSLPTLRARPWAGTPRSPRGRPALRAGRCGFPSSQSQFRPSNPPMVDGNGSRRTVASGRRQSRPRPRSKVPARSPASA